MAKLPDGQYRGTWRGYSLIVMVDCELWEFETQKAVRGAARVTFRIVDGEVDEDSIELVPED